MLVGANKSTVVPTRFAFLRLAPDGWVWVGLIGAKRENSESVRKAVGTRMSTQYFFQEADCCTHIYPALVALYMDLSLQPGAW